jgi:hypothetical protein
VALFALLLIGLAAGPVQAKAGKEKPGKGKAEWPAFPRPTEEETKALVAGLSSADPAVRKRASADLARAGPGALRGLLREVPLTGGAEAEAALLEGLDGWGPDMALAMLLAERSSYAFRYEPEVGQLMAALRKRRPPPAGARSLTLAPGVLEDPERVPPLLASVVTDALVLPGLESPVPARAGPTELALDLARDGGFATKVLAAKPAVVTLATGARTRAVLLWYRLDAWFAAPADLRTGAWGAEPVAVLDVEGDARFDGPADLVRFGDGAFRPLEDGDVALVGDVLVRFQVKSVGPTTHVDGAPEPQLPGVPAGVKEGIVALNRWRKSLGLAPHHLDLPRSQKCQAHVDYWRQNGFTGHAEEPGKPGYSEGGAEAGRSSTAWPVLGPADTVRTIAATILHRVNTLGEAREGYGIGTGAGTALWGGSPNNGHKRHPTCAPGPAQKDVPLTVEAEIPDPQGLGAFYTRPRGYPVTLMWGTRLTAWTEPRIQVFALGPKPISLDGVVFAPGAAYLEKDPANDGALVFVPDQPLATKRTYLARVVATEKGKPVRLEWVFRTK